MDAKMDTKLDVLRELIDSASATRNRNGMMHSLLLIHAEELAQADAYEVCKGLGLPLSYSTEVRKAIKTSETLKALGYDIVKRT